MEGLMAFLKRMSYMKKLAYALTVLVGNASLVYALYIERTLSITWVSAFVALGGFVTTGYLGGKVIAKKGNDA